LKPAGFAAVNGKCPFCVAPAPRRRNAVMFQFGTFRAKVQRASNTEFEFVLSHLPHLDKIAN
jgi:hypothetical protein